MEKLKVLHVIEALGGGVYSYFTDLSHVMGADNRLEVFIAYSNKRKEINPDDVSKDFQPNCKLILLDLVKEINPLKDLQGYLEIKKCIKRVRPHVVHFHSSKAGILGRLAIRSFKSTPSFYTPHGYAFLRKDVSDKKSKFFRALEKNFAKFSKTKTIACGDTEFEIAKKFEESPYLIRNGIRLELMPEKIERTNSKRLIVGTLGRISPQKNPKLINQYISLSPEIDFLWIGDGELSGLLTSPNIKKTGWFTDRTKALPHMLKLDIFIQVSLWEGLPIAMIEAMAMGLPVIASNVIGNKDLVDHGKTGFLVDNDNDYLIALNTLKDQKIRFEMGKAAKKKVRELYNCNKNFKQLADLYIDAVSNI
ncbi:hypothetical protein BST97_11210 [Nonlabens spongiae]|uniref:Glycosyl transferase family 1 n=1 Tax=Nonlabens spongiae TaxID=331648 RepID=A0A1W6MM03_9FLAO|nr:glycosyltransferase [Nonlabens spongiae]ARN78509.1 hypothetical protein BST97_11210 [Nonlabens spongiae]